MRQKAGNRRTASGFGRIRQAKIRSRKAQIRTRTLDGHYDGFCLAKYVDPEVIKRPLNLSRVKIPMGHEA
jgi:hypothetical protein